MDEEKKIPTCNNSALERFNLILTPKIKTFSRSYLMIVRLPCKEVHNDAHDKGGP